jgi:hypothetical protein
LYHREVAVLAQVKTQFVIYSREVTMFFIVLICCLTFVVANLVARWLGNLAASCVAIAALVLSLAMMFYSATIMITTVSLTIAGIVCAVRKADSKAFFKWSAVSFAAAMLASGGITVFDIVYMSDLRQQFAFESMGERLSYENNLVRDDPAGLSNQTTQNHLRQLEDQISLSESGWGGFRNRGIGQMHQNMVERFVNSRGFGGG